jgi:hypothetical protein
VDVGWGVEVETGAGVDDGRGVWVASTSGVSDGNSATWVFSGAVVQATMNRIVNRANAGRLRVVVFISFS